MGFYFFYIYYHGFFSLPCFAVLWGSGMKDTGDASGSRFRSVWRQDASPGVASASPPLSPDSWRRLPVASMSLDD